MKVLQVIIEMIVCGLVCAGLSKTLNKPLEGYGWDFWYIVFLGAFIMFVYDSVIRNKD